MTSAAAEAHMGVGRGAGGSSTAAPEEKKAAEREQRLSEDRWKHPENALKIKNKE